MTNLAQTLRSIKPVLEEKKIIKTKSWSLHSSVHKLDSETMARKLASISVSDLGDLERQRDSVGRDVSSYTTALRDRKKALVEIEKKIEYAKKANDVSEKKKEIDRIMNNLLIEHYEFVEPVVTIFTTEFLKKGLRIMGVYRIWIDWSKDSAGSAIRIINVYKRAGTYDHACISNGSLCMGNSRDVIEQNFKERNVFALLETLISFIVSEDVHSGYIHSWEDWDRQATKNTRELTFESCGIRPGTSGRAVDIQRISRQIESQLRVPAF